MVTVLRFSDKQQATAACALLDLHEGSIERCDVNAILYGAALDIARGTPICGDRANKFRGMMHMFGSDPIKARFLGGTYRATLADDLTSSLSAVDNEARAEILAVSNLALEQAAERVAVKVRHTAKRSALNPIETWSLDNDPPTVFVRSLRANVRSRMFAALTVDEIETVGGELDAGSQLVEAILAGAAERVASLLPDGDLDALAERFATHRAAAVEMWVSSMTAFVLNRLNQATDTEERELDDATVAPNIANDTLSAAGGAQTTPAGGLAKDLAGNLLGVNGEPFLGSRMAQGLAVAAYLAVTAELVPVTYFRHSGGSEGNPIHIEADGQPLSETDARAGSTAGCRCWHETVYEAA